MAYAFVGAVVHIHEEWLPFGRKTLVIDGVTVVLGGDVAFLSPYQAHRLVVAAVSIAELVYLRPGGFPQQLVAHAYSEYRLLRVFHGLAYMLYRLGTEVRVAGAVGEEEAVEVEAVEVVVPGHAGDFHSPAHKAAYYVMLDSAVHQDDFLRGAGVVGHRLGAADPGDVVHVAIFLKFNGFLFRKGVFVCGFCNVDASEHHAFFPEVLGQGAGVDVGDGGDFFVFEPVGEAACAVPMAAGCAVVTDYQGPYVYAAAFQIDRKAVFAYGCGRNSVVAYEWIGQD